jgi:hypothetical protein
VLALLTILFTLARPPAAYLDTGKAHVPLTVSSWCLDARCAAPIAASKRVATVSQGALVRCVFGFDPVKVWVSVGGRRMPVKPHGAVVEWRATRGGGVAITATAPATRATPAVYVTYVARLRFRR